MQSHRFRSWRTLTASVGLRRLLWEQPSDSLDLSSSSQSSGRASVRVCSVAGSQRTRSLTTVVAADPTPNAVHEDVIWGRDYLGYPVMLGRRSKSSSAPLVRPEMFEIEAPLVGIENDKSENWTVRRNLS